MPASTALGMATALLQSGAWHAPAMRHGNTLAKETPPDMPDTFSSVVTLYQPGSVITAPWCQDGEQKRSAFKFSRQEPLAPAEFAGTGKDWVNWTSYTGEDFSGFTINGQQTLGQPPGSGSGGWNPMFAWVKGSSYGGERTYNGITVQVWKIQSPTANLTLLYDQATATPVRYEVRLTTPPTNVTMEYSDFKRNVVDHSLWEGFDKDAFYHPEVCGLNETTPAPVNKTMFIFHPVHKFNISNQDLGDAIGDTFFVCLDLHTNKSSTVDHDYQWITQWEIELIPQWGQYLNCNDYPPVCSGANHWYVGHEAAEALGGAKAGQCSENPLVGEWWSLPEGGRCAEGKRPGDGSCTWRIVQRTKTIDSTCLFKTQKYGDACIADERAPFPKASATFLAAFKTDDTTTGGCPPIKV
eukprot:Hpha_TRINITY_DN15343_c2_g16::TRINITY_DN15343_c2_g16_i1::g.88382::m.88382